MTNDNIEYLTCKNTTKSVSYQISEDWTIQVILPICPYCEQPISGFDYFQSNLSSERLHIECFFEKCNANTYYIKKFYQDSLLPQIIKEREQRWDTYLQQQKTEEK